MFDEIEIPEGVKYYMNTKKEIPENAQVSSTGSLRFNSGKPNMSNLPPEFLIGMAKVMTMGEKKYGKYNWSKGNSISVPYDSGMRHLMAFMSGEQIDKESGEHHLFHAAVNIMMMWYYDKYYPEMDDREYKIDS